MKRRNFLKSLAKVTAVAPFAGPLVSEIVEAITPEAEILDFELPLASSDNFKFWEDLAKTPEIHKSVWVDPETGEEWDTEIVLNPNSESYEFTIKKEFHFIEPELEDYPELVEAHLNSVAVRAKRDIDIQRQQRQPNREGVFTWKTSDLEEPNRALRNIWG